LFFPLYDDIKHLKNHQFWWLEMALEASVAAVMAMLQAYSYRGSRDISSGYKDGLQYRRLLL
jgi:hypothetical protein